MIAVTTEMLFKAIILSGLLGLITGFIHSFFKCLSRVMRYAFYKRLRKTDAKSPKYGLLSNTFDFVIVFVMGNLYLVCNYLFLDGVVDVYSLLMLLISSLAFKHMFDRIFVFGGKKNKQM